MAAYQRRKGKAKGLPDPVLEPQWTTNPPDGKARHLASTYFHPLKRAAPVTYMVVSNKVAKRIEPFLNEASPEPESQPRQDEEPEPGAAVEIFEKAASYNMPKLKRKPYVVQGIQYIDIKTEPEQPPEIEHAPTSSPPKKRKRAKPVKVERQKLSDNLQELVAEKRAILPLPTSGVPVLAGCADFQLPYEIWWEHANGILARKMEEADFVKVRAQIGLEARASEDMDVCSCKLPSDGGVGCRDETCENRMTFVECWPANCPCKKKCGNRRFQNRETYAHALTRFQTENKGAGVKAKAVIPQGALVLEYVGEVMTAENYRDRVKTKYAGRTHFHCMNLDMGLVIDGGSYGSEARFINHSCDPNCHIEKWNVLGFWRIGIFASRDIHPGEELGYDYNFQSFGEDKTCYCGSAKCRGKMGSKEGLDNKVEGAAPLLNDGGKRKPGRKRKPKKEEGLVLLEALRKPLGPRIRKMYQQNKLLLPRNMAAVRRGVLKAELTAAAVAASAAAIAVEEADHQVQDGDDPSDASGPAPIELTGVTYEAFKTKLSYLKFGGRAPRTRGLAISDQAVDVDRLAQLVHILMQVHSSLLKIQVPGATPGTAAANMCKPFLKLPSQKQYPDYYERIKNPIELTSIGERLAEGQYQQLKLYTSDVNRVFNNAIKYNKKGTDLHNDAVHLRSVFGKKIREVKKLIEAIYVEDSPNVPEKQPEQEPEVDDSTIRCICNRFVDEGQMVQCETCLAWEHCDCVGIKDPEAVESHLCQRCRPTGLSREIPFEAVIEADRLVTVAGAKTRLVEATELVNELAPLVSELGEAIPATKDVIRKLRSKQDECVATLKLLRPKRLDKANNLSLKWQALQRKQRKQLVQAETAAADADAAEAVAAAAALAAQRDAAAAAAAALAAQLEAAAVAAASAAALRASLSSIPYWAARQLTKAKEVPRVCPAVLCTSSTLSDIPYWAAKNLPELELPPRPPVPVMQSKASRSRARALRRQRSELSATLQKLRQLHCMDLIPVVRQIRQSEEQLDVVKAALKDCNAALKDMEARLKVLLRTHTPREEELVDAQYVLDQLQCQYFKTLVGSDGHQYRLGDCVYVNQQGGQRKSARDRRQAPIYRIEKMWRDAEGNAWGLGRIFLRISETHHFASQKFYDQELAVKSGPPEMFSMARVLGLCWVLRSKTFLQGRPIECTDEEDVYVADFRYSADSKSWHKLSQKMSFPTPIHLSVFRFFTEPPDFVREIRSAGVAATAAAKTAAEAKAKAKAKANAKAATARAARKAEAAAAAAERDESSGRSRQRKRPLSSQAEEDPAVLAKKRALLSVVDRLLKESAPTKVAARSGRMTTAFDSSAADFSRLLRR